MDDQIAFLRKLSSQKDMRKKLIGGFSEEDVTMYVNNISQHFQQIENEYKQNLENLQSSKAELRREFDEYIQQTGEQLVELQEALKKAAGDSSYYLHECQVKDEIIIELNEKHAAEIDRLASENQQFGIETEKLTKQLSALELEFENLKATTEESKNEKNLYMTQITDLEKELSAAGRRLDESLRAYEELERQIEHLEANQATDKDIAALTEKIKDLEEALQESQDNVLEEQKIHEQVKKQVELEKKAEIDKYNGTINLLAAKNQQLEKQLQESKNLLAAKNQELEKQLQESKNLLTAKNQELEKQLQESKNLLTAENQELEKQLQESKKMAEEQRKEIKTIEEQLRKEHEAVVKALEEKLNQSANTVDPLNDIHAIYLQLDKLKEQVTVIENLQQQLESERLRADKAEKDMSQFRQWISVLKERLHKDQKELEVQFTEIEEKYKKMHTDVNGFRSNLEIFRTITETELDEFYTTIKENELSTNKKVQQNNSQAHNEKLHAPKLVSFPK